MYDVAVVALVGSWQGFGLRNRILCPRQVDASQIRILGRERDRSFLGLEVDFELAFGIDLGREGVHAGEREEGRGFHHAEPVKRIDNGGEGEKPRGGGGFLKAGGPTI